MLRAFLIYFLLLGVLSSCGGIKLLSGNKSDLYRKEFLASIGKIKKVYGQGEADSALQQLQAMDDSQMLPTEKAMRRNLMGVILFSKKNYEQAIFNFDLASSSSKEDESLNAQIFLNIASTYFKMRHLEKAYSTSNNIDFKQLRTGEQKKFHKLRYTLSKELNKNKEDQLVSLTWYLSGYKNLNELKADPYFEIMMTIFSRLNATERFDFLEDFENEKFLIIGYLGYLEAEKRYYQGDKDGAKSALSWVESEFSELNDIQSLVKSFLFRMDNSAKLDPRSIGLILPLSGERKTYGERALLGVDNSLRDFSDRNPEAAPFELHIKDSNGSGAVGAFRVKELVEKHYVSAIIGGLYSTEAAKEYLEAKKHGVLFISLSQVYLPKEQKDHLLIEVPGSVESQIDQVFSEEMLTKFGKRAAIIYPNSSRGDAYIDEFWRRAQLSGVEVTGALSFEKEQSDYRDPVKNLLGLKFTRERQEELEILQEIHSLEKNRSIRRLQTLRPLIDFDWVFIPAFPKEALQLIPSFSYFDAFNLNIIGGPSWRSQTLSRESYKLGRLFFVGDDVAKTSKQFVENFANRYRRRPRLIEMRGYDAFGILNTLLQSGNYSSRDELDISIRSQENLKGLTGDWRLQDGIWIKNMVSLSMKRGKIRNLFYTNVNEVQVTPAPSSSQE